MAKSMAKASNKTIQEMDKRHFLWHMKTQTKQGNRISWK